MAPSDRRGIASLLKTLVGLGMLVCFLTSYVHLVYMPQKAIQDDQQDAIRRLENEVERLTGMHLAMAKALQSGDAKVMAKVANELVRDAPRTLNATASFPRESVHGDDSARHSGTHENPALADRRKRLARRPRGLGRAKETAATQVRQDGKCGKANPTPDGKPGICDPDGLNPCCAPSGWCGSTPAHCTCSGCINYSIGPATSDEDEDEGAYDELKPKSIAIVVPFRDRGAHLDGFRIRIRALIEAWRARGANHSWTVVIAEQFDNALFNRGYLFNAGFQLALSLGSKDGRSFDCVVMHDIDILPEPNVDYGWCRQPIQLSGEISCWQGTVPYPTNVGGVVSLSPTHWRRINGFSNEYEGWGGEDDDLYLRLKQNDLLKGQCHTWCAQKSKTTDPVVMRPPLGKGKFICLHDGDHTPRQRSPDDRAMWKRLNEMQSNSKKWRSDGISNVQMHLALRGYETTSCVAAACTAPDAVVTQPGPFGELWTKLSSKPIPLPTRIHVAAPAEVSPSCRGSTKALLEIPTSMGHLRAMLVELFGRCGLQRADADSMEFALIDGAAWHVLLVGSSATLAVADSDNRQPKSGKAELQAIHAERLARWVRKLPAYHRGYIVPISPNQGGVGALQAKLIGWGRRIQQVAPACISSAAYMNGKKYRLTPATTWCGDAGWSHVNYFDVLRSKSSVEPADRFAVCVSFNTKNYVYRFAKGETSCLRPRSASSSNWRHEMTFHSSLRATGDNVCVGVKEAGDESRWIIKKASKCDFQEFKHSFSFRAMSPTSPFQLVTQACIVSAQDVVRLAPSPFQSLGDKAWTLERELLFLTVRQSSSDVKFCVAVGQAPSWSSWGGRTIWRGLLGADCNQQDQKLKLPSGSDGSIVEWTPLEPVLFAPTNSTGVRVCFCEKGGGSGTGTWREGRCEESHKNDFCVRSLSPAEGMNYAHLVDEA